MKKVTVILFLAISLQTLAQDSIPNANFESWIIGTVPANWHTTNQFILPDTFNAIRTSDCHSGQYAMELSTIDYGGIIIPGVATVGTLDIGTTFGGIPFSARPVSFSGYIKHPSQGDEIMIFVEFIKNGNQVGSCYWSTSDSLGSFTQFTVPVSYSSGDMPDTLNITMMSDPGKPGSRFIVDDLVFEFEITGMERPEAKTFEIFPNPTTDRIYLRGIEKVTRILISSISGKLIWQGIPENDQSIVVSHLDKGLYFITVFTFKGIYCRKLLKQ